MNSPSRELAHSTTDGQGNPALADIPAAPVQTITFTEKQIDGAACQAAHAAVVGLPDELVSFLTNSQLGGLQSDVWEFIKTSLLFDLMNHLEPET